MPTLRFAPSPNGLLHLGHAFSALVTAAWARRLQGRLLLRIEDIDPQRSRRDFIEAIMRDLAWLGLEWEEPVRHQSEHMDDYRAALARLDALGVLYPCFASRAEIRAAAGAARDPDGAPLYPGLHRHLPPAEIAARKARGEPFALRLDMQAALGLARERAGGRITFTELSADGEARRIEACPERWGDVVIARKDVPTSYHLAVVVDDALQGVTHVTRGRDLLAATDIHRLLQILLELPEPVYHHHRLVLGPDGAKLSKSRGDRALAALRAAGASPADIRRRLGLD